ncbi:nitroreductase family protein [Pedobacter nanyangensis]|uniref:nitroreductase family protein n=1 Tax=Pedobacter nanyangensis TaxID=1562389 RepID=UPI0013B3E297|nr:nitroreductase family protein [Pedobacter nanyangensis]
MENPSPKEIQDLILPFQYPLDHVGIRLNRPEQDPELNFFSVIKDRKSIRNLKPLKEKQLDYLFWFAARVYQASVANDYILSHRASPSAGGIHPIDILVHRPENSFFEYYSPFEHHLYKVQLEQEIIQSLLCHIDLAFPNRDTPLLWFLAHGKRTKAFYQNFESLVWRDAGALLQTFQLTCTALGMGSCAVGTLGEPFISSLFGEDIVSAGGIIIGNI